MNQDDLDTLTEVRQEIRRINQAAMRTIFNPAATEALEELIQKGTNQINYCRQCKIFLNISKKSLSVSHHLNINQERK